MMKNIKLFEIIAVIVMVSLTVLAGVSCSKANANGSLEGVTWVLKSYGDPNNLTNAVPDTEVTLIFNKENQSAGGNGGVNVYGGNYEVNGDELIIKDVIHTLIYGPEPQQEQENAFFKILESAKSYKIDGKQLTITGAEGVLVFSQK